MWRAGFDLELAAWIANALALALGAGLGFRALVDPNWAARLARLKEAEAGGFAAFRATYGGFFFGAHAVALYLSAQWIWSGGFELGVYATSTSALLAAAWGGASLGRVMSIVSDGARTRFNLLAAAFEALIALAIAAPLLAWLFSRPG